MHSTHLRFFPAFCLFAASSVCFAQSYHLTDLGVIPGQQLGSATGLNQHGQVSGASEFFASRYMNGVQENLGLLPGGSTSAGNAINNLGDVVGWSTFTNGGSIRHASLFRNGTVTDLGSLPLWGNYSAATSINDSRQVVGYSGFKASTSNTHAFIWDAAGGLRDLGTLGGPYAKAFSINNAGQVTGSAYTTAVSTSVAYIWDAVNGMRALGTIDGNYSTGYSINANGHVAGVSTINNFDNREHAFFWDGAVMHDLGAIGDNDFYSDRSYAYGINIHDHIVGGTYRPYAGGGLYGIPFIYRDGQMFDLTKLVDSSGDDYALGAATAINDAGQIIMRADRISTGGTHAVLLTPTPKIDSLSRLGNGNFLLQARGEPNKTYRVLINTDPRTAIFSDAGATVAAADGAIRFEHAPSTSGKSLYRLGLP